MLHLFLIDNESVPDVSYPGRYIASFLDKIALDDFNGLCLMAEMQESQYFHTAYVRIQNDTDKHKDRFYIIARFDHAKFPQMEGYVERRVMPELDRVLDEVEEIFELDLDDQLEAYSEEYDLGLTMYIYDADTDAINASISGWLRDLTMHEVEDGTEDQPGSVEDPTRSGDTGSKPCQILGGASAFQRRTEGTGTDL